MTASVYQTILEKAALDSGYDLPRGFVDSWLHFASSHVPLKIWIKADSDPKYLSAFSDSYLAESLNDFAVRQEIPLPDGAAFSMAVKNIQSLYPLLRRAFQLSRSLPCEPLREFEKQIRGLPSTTEAERLVVQRVGQDIFRSRLMDYWDAKCAVTGLAIPELLKASHIKPWRDCESDAERLDVFNGLLLSPNLDAVFDQGLITFDNQGIIKISKNLDIATINKLNFEYDAKISNIAEQHWKYLQWHRQHIFLN